MLFDLHVHTAISPCGSATLDEMIDAAVASGLHGICITDHDTLEAKRHIDEGLQPNGLRVFVGMEYATGDGDLLVFGPWKHLPEHLPADALLKYVAQHNGAAIAAHPFRRLRPASEHLVASGLCRIVETLNGRNTDLENQKAGAWRKRYDIIESAGSDAHSVPEVGRLATRFHVPLDTLEDLVNALNKGWCTPVSRGSGMTAVAPWSLQPPAAAHIAGHR